MIGRQPTSHPGPCLCDISEGLTNHPMSIHVPIWTMETIIITVMTANMPHQRPQPQHLHALQERALDYVYETVSASRQP